MYRRVGAAKPRMRGSGNSPKLNAQDNDIRALFPPTGCLAFKIKIKSFVF